MKDKLLISFSGGETSAYMLFWCLLHWKEKFEMKIVFANTGLENEETLIFVKKCAEHFKCEVIWVEGVFHKQHMKGTTHKIVNFETATRSKKLFEEMIKVYGIPNQAYPHCNRELKLAPIKSYMRSIGWKNYYTAIGIRNDEIDRVNSKYKSLKLVYPFVTEKPITKPHINFWWNMQPFRLNLKGYEGNCKTCWKKSDLKLWTIANETPEKFEDFDYLERKYSRYIPPSRNDKGKTITFFRNNRSAKEILKEAELNLKKAIDDSQNINFQSSLLDEDESCDVYAMCGS
jgi:hypothetical protein